MTELDTTNLGPQVNLGPPQKLMQGRRELQDVEKGTERSNGWMVFTREAIACQVMVALGGFGLLSILFKLMTLNESSTKIDVSQFTTLRCASR